MEKPYGYKDPYGQPATITVKVAALGETITYQMRDSAIIDTCQRQNPTMGELLDIASDKAGKVTAALAVEHVHTVTITVKRPLPL